MSFTHRNHYVPQWYQRRFLPAGEGKYFFLKLRPRVIVRPDGHRHRETALHRWGPPSCFYEDDLYTTRFGTVENDDIEKHLFGRIDGRGKEWIDHFCDYSFTAESSRALRSLMAFMDAQVLRTPRGLARIERAVGFGNHNTTLLAMQRLRQIHGTMWAECVWEIVDCGGTGLDLIVSDNPVTFFNRGIFPGARECAFPSEPDLALLGTQTLFPLSKDKLLVLTHTQFARDPSYDPRKVRLNPRFFGQTIFNLADIISGSRTLSREDVLKVNYIIKSRAHQYIAASTQEGLYPERELTTTHWSKLGAKEFLLPDPREMIFSTAVIAGYDDGRPAWGVDEYGRPPGTPGKDMEDKNRVREFAAFHRRQMAWEKKLGPLPHAPPHFRNMQRKGPPRQPAAATPGGDTAPASHDVAPVAEKS
jgi:hypothetical protein